MFRRVAPQRAEDSAGRVVQVQDRYHIRYVSNDGGTADIGIDFGSDLSGLYPASLEVRTADGRPVTPSKEEEEEILDCVKEGLDSLGIRYEVVEGLPP